MGEKKAMNEKKDFRLESSNSNEKKSHFLIPDSEVKKVIHSPTSRPKPLDIDHVSHGQYLAEGIQNIKNKRKDIETPISKDIVIFKVEMHEGDKVDARGDYEKIFLENDLKINAVKKSHVAIVSSTLQNLERLENKLTSYVSSNGKRSSFFQYIDNVNYIQAEDKQTTRMLEAKESEQNSDIQVTLLPNLDQEIYEKMLKYLEGKLGELNGKLLEDVYFLSDNTPVIRAIIPSSGIDILSDQEIIYKVEPTPFYFSGSDKKNEMLNVSNIELKYETSKEKLPLVCILDDGIKLPENLDDCVAGYWKAPDISELTAEHGTKVASRAIFGDNLDKYVLEDKVLVPKVRVIDAVIYDGRGRISEGQFIRRIRRAVEEIHEVTKIFNLSFNATFPINDDEISNLAYELDTLMIKYGVQFVVPTGNHSLWHNCQELSQIITDSRSRLAPPAESFLGLTVGAVTREKHEKSISNAQELAPFSRVGLGFCGTAKPDIAYPGGNVYVEEETHYIAANSAAYVINNQGFLEAEFGTSFSSPIGAADLALLTETLPNKNPFVAKALLLHHAELSIPMSNLYQTQQEDICEKVYGKGMGNLQEAQFSHKSRATYVRYGEMSRLVKERVMFHMPSTISSLGKRKSKTAQVKVTCLCIPPLDKSGGYEYLRAYVDTSLHCLNSNGTEVTRNPAGNRGREKWRHVHHFSQEFTTFNPGDWQIWLQLYTKPEVIDDEKVKYVLIVTIEDLTEQNADIYGGIENEVNERFLLLNEVDVEVDVEVDGEIE